ncbi:MAG: hypothetical protein EA344_07540 [Alkalicoccus sp.]|nr:MAG: hypothetical protein EA344_07540 [Alkalicoccus sp.]
MRFLNFFIFPMQPQECSGAIKDEAKIRLGGRNQLSPAHRESVPEGESREPYIKNTLLTA